MYQVADLFGEALLFRGVRLASRVQPGAIAIGKKSKADGSRSFVRSTCGIETRRIPAETHYLNLFFRADLIEAVRDRTFSQCEIANEEVRGLFLSKNNTTEFSPGIRFSGIQPDRPL